MKCSDNNFINYIRQSNTSRQDENKKKKSKGSSYIYGRAGHYKPNCPLLKKDKEKGQQKKSRNPRRAYIALESDSESSNEGISSESDEMANVCFM